MTKKNYTIKDIAKISGVSIATVSNVVNNKGRVSKNTKDKIAKIINEKNYKPSLSARSLKKQNSRLISVIVPFLKKGEFEENPFFWQLITGVESVARNQSFHVMLTGVSNNEDLSFVHNRHLDGMIVVGIKEKTTLFNRIINIDVPCVFMDSYLSSEDYFQVNSDDRLGGYLATKHLLNMGHDKIMLLSSSDIVSKESDVDYQRWLGYRQALNEDNVSYDKELVYRGGQSMLSGYYAAQDIYNKLDKVSAVFVLSDIGAMGLIKGLRELGVSVPRDISVMGYDDIFYTDFMLPSLTTIRQDIIKKGRTAISLLLNQVNNNISTNKRKVILPVELKVRESSSRKL